MMNDVAFEHLHLPDEVVAGKAVNLRETLLKELSDDLALLLRAFSLNPTLKGDEEGGVVEEEGERRGRKKVRKKERKKERKLEKKVKDRMIVRDREK